MVALTELAQAAALQGEKDILNQGLASLDAGSIIVSMTFGPEMTVTIPTDTFTYPFEMLNAIREQIIIRRNAVEKELSDLGVTGVAEPAPQAAASSDAPASHTGRRH